MINYNQFFLQTIKLSKLLVRLQIEQYIESMIQYRYKTILIINSLQYPEVRNKYILHNRH